jgi:hypothetical protein
MSESTGWLDLVRRPLDRKRTMLAVGAVTTQAASGAFFMIAYGTYFFEMAGVGNAFENSCILSGVGVAAILFCVAIMPRFGRRRRFLTTSLIICGITQLIVAIVYTKRDKNNPEMTGKLIVAFSIIYIVAYNGGMSSFAWVVGGELPRQSLRSYTFGAAAGVGFLGAWLAAFTAPYFINPASLNWGPQVRLFPSLVWTLLTSSAVRLHLVPQLSPGRSLRLLLHPGDQGPHSRGDQRALRGRCPREEVGRLSHFDPKQQHPGEAASRNCKHNRGRRYWQADRRCLG